MRPDNRNRGRGGGGGRGRGRGGKRPFNNRDGNRGGSGSGHSGGYRGRGGRGGNGGRPDRPEFRQMNNLKEIDVGITEFIGNGIPPFNGIIKTKFSDFQVNEIDLDGNIVTLTDLTVPEPPEDEETAHILQAADPDLRGIVTKEQWDGIKQMVEKKDKLMAVLIDVETMDKEDRKEVHVIVKSRFGQIVNSSTVVENGKKYIKVSLYTKNAKADTRTKWTWPHEYTYFVVHKFNLDTMKACSELALNLNCKPSVLAYAGTKDKRANTSQLFCIRKRTPDAISRAARRIANLYVGNFTFKPVTLKLGNLLGNRFKIALRQISVDQSVVEESLNSIKENGFINYYGLQRFGNSATVPTFVIGKALLQGKWSEAVELIMKPRDGEPEFMAKMRDFWWQTRDAEGARRMLHTSNNSIEAKLLFGLAKCDDNDIVNALENIPRNVRLLYMHSYQSLLWNKAASKRVKLGHKPIVGDLVFVETTNVVTESIEEEIVDEDQTAEETEKSGGDVEMAEEAEEEKKVDYKALVKALTQSDVDSGAYTMFDVVLPLPGYDIAYPTNEIGAYYEEMMAEDDLSSAKMQQKNKSYSLTGAYRKLFEKPGDMTWQFAKYDNDQQMLLNTDFELIKKDRLITLSQEGAMTACLLEFNLTSSTYATMALREILKVDTSTQNQIKLAKESEKAAETKTEADVTENVVEAEDKTVEEDEPEAKKVKLEEEEPKVAVE